jgi:hypothetical protein
MAEPAIISVLVVRPSHVVAVSPNNGRGWITQLGVKVPLQRIEVLKEFDPPLWQRLARKCLVACTPGFADAAKPVFR